MRTQIGPLTRPSQRRLLYQQRCDPASPRRYTIIIAVPKTSKPASPAAPSISGFKRASPINQCGRKVRQLVQRPIAEDDGQDRSAANRKRVKAFE